MILLLSWAKHHWHDSGPMRWLRQQCFAGLQQAIRAPGATGSLPVVVVDISNLRMSPASPPPTSSPLRDFTRGLDFTPRDTLGNLLQALKELDPIAIGFDIDMSPIFDGSEPPQGHLEFLQSCLTPLSPDRPLIPTFVGADRAIGLSSQAWLGGPEFARLATTTYGFAGVQERMVSGLRWDSTGGRLSSLSQALADAYFGPKGSTAPRPRWPFRPPITEEYQKGWIQGTNHFQVCGFLVDYNFIDALRTPDSGFVDATNVIGLLEKPAAQRETALRPLRRAVAGRVVIIGDLREARTSESFTILSKAGSPLPGVLSHACAACTLILCPLTELSAFPGLLAALAIALAVIYLNSWLAHRLSRLAAEPAVEILVNALALLGVLTLTVILARWFHVLWLDAISACFVLGLECHLSLLTLNLRLPRRPSP